MTTKNDQARWVAMGTETHSPTAMETPAGSELFKLPWHTSIGQATKLRRLVKDRDGMTIAVPRTDADGLDEQCAEFIVRAVNAHDDMLAALKALKRRICFIGMPQEPWRDDGAPEWRKEIALLESAIAKAEGR